MKRRVWAVISILTLLAPVTARADQTTFGVAITGTHGTHREDGGTATAPLIPAPVLGISHRFKQFELSAEGLPPIGAIPVANNGLGMQSIALTYGDITLRHWNKRQTFAVGFGETLYNQRTTFLDYQSSRFKDSSVDTSRVAGARYEVLGRIALPAQNAIQLQFAVNPALHGGFIDESQSTNLNLGRTFTFTRRPEWEKASQVDADVRFTHSYGAYALSYGVRYLNYTAQFTQRPWAPFADANSLVMPYVAIQRTWGH